ncbi:MAG: hypothetical protein J6L23_01410 [Clostridia bacterium]|nr:hypothetical protein [Clostridia bacterium]
MELKFIVLKNSIYQTKKDPRPVCSNSDYTAVFTFDKYWNGIAKTARFICYGKNRSPIEAFDVPIVDGKCKIPPINVAGKVTVGVYGGDVISTNTTCLTFVESPLTTSAPQRAPSESVYNKIMTLFEKYYLKSAKIKQNGDLVLERGDGTKLNAGSTDGITVVGEKIQADWNEPDEASPSYVKNKPPLENEVLGDSENAVSSFAIYDALKTKLDEPVAEGINGQALFYSANGPHWSDIPHPERISVDDELNEFSKNPVENQAVTKALSGIKGSECTIEGTSLSFNSEKATFRGLKVLGKTSQLRTPSPASPIPLENVSAANLFSKDDAVLGKALGSSGTVYSDAAYCYSDAIPVTQGLTYTASSVSWANFYSDNNAPTSANFVAQLASSTFVAPNEAKYVRLCAPISKLETAMLTIGATARGYRPHNDGQESLIITVEGESAEVQKLVAITKNGLCGIPVSTGGNYTDENGTLWMCDELDLERGVLIKRTNTITFKGTENFITLGVVGSSNAFFYQVDSSVKPLTVNNEGFSLCSHYEKKPIISSTTDIGHQVRKVSNSTECRILFRPEGIASMSGSTFMQWLKNNPMTVTYVLEKPIEIPLSKDELKKYKTIHTNYPATTVTSEMDAVITAKYLVRGAMPTNTELCDLLDDEMHRLVTDDEKAYWNSKTSFSGSYNDLTDKPTIPSEYKLPTATASTKGGVIVGDGLMIDGNGVLSANASSGIVCIDRTLSLSAIKDSVLSIGVDNSNEGYYVYHFHIHLRDQNGRDVTHLISGAYIPSSDSDDVNAAHVNSMKTRGASISAGLPTTSSVTARQYGVQCTYDFSDNTITTVNVRVCGWYRIF